MPEFNDPPVTADVGGSGIIRSQQKCATLSAFFVETDRNSVSVTAPKLT